MGEREEEATGETEAGEGRGLVNGGTGSGDRGDHRSSDETSGTSLHAFTEGRSASEKLGIRDNEDSLAVIESIRDGIATTGAAPLAELLDNKPSPRSTPCSETRSASPSPRRLIASPSSTPPNHRTTDSRSQKHERPSRTDRRSKARQSPDVRAILDAAFDRLAFSDPERHVAQERVGRVRTGPSTPDQARVDGGRRFTGPREQGEDFLEQGAEDERAFVSSRWATLTMTAGVGLFLGLSHSRISSE